MPEALHPDLARLLDEVAANQAKADSFSDLSTPQFNWRSEPGRWSIAQCISHLNIIASGDIQTIRMAIADARRRNLTGAGPYRYGWLSRWFVSSMEPPVKTKFKAPKFYQPPPEAGPAKTLAEYRENCRQLSDLMRESNGLDLAKVKTPLVQPKWAKMPLGARFALLTAHDRRHLWQAAGVRDRPRFPAA
jgi:hypothetical protein